jgi:hypothetical protein
VSKFLLSFQVTAVVVDKLLSEVHLEDISVTLDKVHCCDILCMTEGVLFVTNHVFLY